MNQEKKTKVNEIITEVQKQEEKLLEIQRKVIEARDSLLHHHILEEKYERMDYACDLIQICLDCLNQARDNMQEVLRS